MDINIDESYIFGVMPLLTKILCKMMAPDRQALVPHALVLYSYNRGVVAVTIENF